jgi:two-component system OmpR family response regulator
VMERDADARSLVAASLRLAGAQILEADSVEAALVRCAEMAPDVILADLTYPGSDGHVLIEKLRASPEGVLAQIPVLAVAQESLVSTLARAVASR